MLKKVVIIDASWCSVIGREGLNLLNTSDMIVTRELERLCPASVELIIEWTPICWNHE